MAKIKMDLSEVKTEGGYKTTFVPAGNYVAKIVESEIADTKSGKALNLLFEVTQGEHKGSRFMERLNIVNASKDAEQMSKSRLKRIAELACVMNPEFVEDSEELHECEMKYRGLLYK